MSQLLDDLITEANLIMSSVLNRSYVTICGSALVLLGLIMFPLHSYHGHQHFSSSRIDTNLYNYFGEFEGFSECNIHAAELYATPTKDHLGFYEYGAFCYDRKQLLKALSEGGRVGFDAPYEPRGCKYRWFDVEEMCFILERFDGLVFAGDESLQTIYNGLNILLRRDLALGSLDLTSMDQAPKEQCRCNNQFTKQDCRQHYLLDSTSHGDWMRSGFFCNRIRHAILKVDSADLGAAIVDKFQQLIPKAPRSRYRPIPIIHSLGPSSVSEVDAAKSLLKFIELADESGRNTPMLWIGPTAAGHVELKGRKGNQEIWDFDHRMAATARENDVDVLGMWNMTVQASSWDGTRFGEKVAITQAMMVMNWLSRLEST